MRRRPPSPRGCAAQRSRRDALAAVARFQLMSLDVGGVPGNLPLGRCVEREPLRARAWTGSDKLDTQKSDKLGSGTTALPLWAQLRRFAVAGSIAKLIAEVLMRGSQRAVGGAASGCLIACCRDWDWGTWAMAWCRGSTLADGAAVVDQKPAQRQRFSTRLTPAGVSRL
jgi:hypothetical protein